MMDPRERLIIALDMPTAGEALSLVGQIGGAVGAFKIGSQLFTAAGPDLVREIARAGFRVFLDLKFHDIPNTVAAAAVEAARLGAWMIDVHAAGGSEMMKRAVSEVRETCEREAIARPKMIAVTVLTSADQETLRETGVAAGVSSQVAALARLAADAGLDGVVSSPHEVGLIRDSVEKPGFLIVTPGIRANSGTADDQRRVMTFAEAVAAGSDYVVVGRPVTQAADSLAAVERMVAGE
jgi:orotidine-5'-phosphate decarboxylase